MDVKNATTSKTSFQAMELSPIILSALAKMQFTNPTPIQSQAVPAALAGNDIIAVAQTGSGKTLAYALPLLSQLEKKPTARALILAPSREMAQQIFKVFTELCAELPITSCLVIGGTPGAKQTSQLKKNPRLIVATPGRMNDHLITNKLLLQNVEVIVIDEADRMLDMGFAPQLKSIQNTLRGPRQTMMFSASFGKNVESIAQLFMKQKPLFIKTEQAETPVETLKQKILFIDNSRRNDRLLDELNATKGGVIVFTGDQETCVKVGKHLKEFGYATDLIHGQLSQGHRNRVIREFREGQIRIIVATDVLARGLDFPHVDHVINYDLPFESEDFLHRIGRTARAGRGGTAITFVLPNDTKRYNRIKSYLVGAEEIKVDPNFKFKEPFKKYISKSSKDESGKKNTERTFGKAKGHPEKNQPKKFNKNNKK